MISKIQGEFLTHLIDERNMWRRRARLRHTVESQCGSLLVFRKSRPIHEFDPKRIICSATEIELLETRTKSVASFFFDLAILGHDPRHRHAEILGVARNPTLSIRPPRHGLLVSLFSHGAAPPPPAASRLPKEHGLALKPRFTMGRR